MTEKVNRYRVYCTDSPAHYEYEWGTTTPTVCPSNGTPIDTSLTTVVQTLQGNDSNIVNFPLTALGELLSESLTPMVQIGFTYNNSDQLTKSTTSGSGSVTNSDHMAVISTGTSTSSTARFESVRPLKYRPGQGICIRFTALFTTGVTGNTQKIGAFNGEDGIGFGFNGSDFGLFRMSGGTINWVSQTDWNLDKLDGAGSSGVNINFGDGFGNVFGIKFQYLGFGALFFTVENPESGIFITVHRIGYANTATIPSFHITTFPLAIESENTTNNTDIIIKSASMFGAAEGSIVYTGPQFNDFWLNISVGNSTETFIAAWQVKTTFHGNNNKTVVYVTQYSTATGSADKPQILRFRKNGTFTSPIWTDINTSQSVVQRLTSGTWNGDGTLINLLVVQGSCTEKIEINSNSLFGVPGDIFIITLEGIIGSGSNTGSLSWLEDQ